MTVDSHPGPRRISVTGAFVAIYVTWGSTYLAIRYVVETLPPLLAAGLRFSLAGAILYAWVRARGAGRPSWVHWRSAAVLGALLLAGGGGAVHWAEQFVPSSVTVLLITTVPVWMVLIHWLQRDGRGPSVAEAAGVILGFAGVVLLAGSGDLGGGQPVHRLGALVLILGSLSWAIGSVYSRRFKLPVSPLLATSMEMLVGGVVLLAIGTIGGELADVEPDAVTVKSALALGYLIVFGSIIGFTAYVWLLRVSTPARVSTYAFVNPVVAVILGCTLGGEPFTPRFMVSALIIMAAVVLITMSRRQVRKVKGETAPAGAIAPKLDACRPRTKAAPASGVPGEGNRPVALCE